MEDKNLNENEYVRKKNTIGPIMQIFKVREDGGIDCRWLDHGNILAKAFCEEELENIDIRNLPSAEYEFFQGQLSGFEFRNRRSQ